MRRELFIATALLTLCLQFGAVRGQTGTTYTLHVGAWGDDASIGNSGVGVEIRTHSYPIPSSDTDHAFWVGNNLANGGFIQFGYELQKSRYCLYGHRVGDHTSCNGSYDNIANGDARWFWQYWPNVTVLDFYFGIGAVNSAGPDGTWHTYQILPATRGWSFVLDGKTVANMNVFQSTNSNDRVYVNAEEVTSSPSSSGDLGPVEFRNLAYYNQSWSEVKSLMAQTDCVAVTGEVTPNCGINIPYGITVLGPNHILAGSGQQLRKSRELLWGVLYSGTILITRPAPPYCAYHYELAFNATHSEEITGSLSSDGPVNFYVMTDSFFQTGQRNGYKGCVITDTSNGLLFSRVGVTSLSVDFTVNDPGTYHFYLQNMNTNATANVKYSFSVAASNTTSATFQGWTGDITSAPPRVTLTTNSPKPMQTIWAVNNSQSYVALAVTVIAIIVVGGIIMKRRGHRSSAGS